MWAEVRQSLVAALELLLPPICHLCDRPVTRQTSLHDFCPPCHAGIPPLAPARCTRCARPFAADHDDLHLCADCLRQPPPFAGVCALGSYRDGLREAIHRLKYRGRLELASPLGLLLAERLVETERAEGLDLLLPVPLHHRRLRQRGYNQAVEVARPLARALHLPLETRMLRRLRETPPQQGLSAAERRRNMRGAFTLTRPLCGETVLLVDDVMTTGETLRECCRTLAAGGAAEILVAVLGRA